MTTGFAGVNLDAQVFLNAGSGVYAASVSYFLISGYDGGSNGYISIRDGNGDGTFGAVKSYATSTVGDSTHVATDMNGDGQTDVVMGGGPSQQLSVLINDHGSFLAPTVYTNVGRDIHAADLNGDGYSDIVSSASCLFNRGDGILSPATVFGPLAQATGTAIGDFNGDSVDDLVYCDGVLLTADVLISNTTAGIGALKESDLATKAGAKQALAPLTRVLDNLAKQRGVIGAFQRRLESALPAIQAMVNNSHAADSRIRDVDVALEAAAYARNTIREQAAAAALAHAYAGSRPVLQLIESV